MENQNASQDQTLNAPGPRFCHHCGEPLQPGATTCPACSPSLKPAAPESPLLNAGNLEIRKAFFLYGVLLASSALVFMTPFDKDEILDRILLFDGITVVIVLLTVAFSWKTIASALPGDVRLLHFGLAAAIAVGTFWAAEWYGRALLPFLPEDLPDFVDILAGTGLSRWQQLAVIAAIPAVFEELAFRGLILPFLTTRMPVVQAVVVSSAAFAILHMEWLYIPFLFGMGLTLGWLRVATGSLIPPMLVHFFHNGAVWLTETVK